MELGNLLKWVSSFMITLFVMTRVTGADGVETCIMTPFIHIPLSISGLKNRSFFRSMALFIQGAE